MNMVSQFDRAMDKLKHSGVRMTPQRHEILAFLLDSTSHPSADETYKALEKKFPSMSLATVYNNLKVFLEAGLVRELTYGDHSSRFDANLADHYHAICRGCGKITDFTYPPLYNVELAAADATGFRIHGHRMEVYGYCPECTEE